MLKRKSKEKLRFGKLITLAILLGISYVGASFYSVPEKASAVTWFPKEETRTLADIGYLQDMNIEICKNTVAQELTQVFTLIDKRDRNNYTVRVLPDGKCWMTQNLRLAGGSVLNRTNTNLDSNIYSTDDQTYTLPIETSGGFSNTILSDKNGKNTYMNHQVRNSTSSDYGAYYSWCAATAGTCVQGTYADIQPQSGADGVYYTGKPAQVVVDASSKASSSICPRGWRLPTGGSGEAKGNDFAKAVGLTDGFIISPGVNYWSDTKNPSMSTRSITVNNNSWSMAGMVSIDGNNSMGSSGHYWANGTHNIGAANTLSLYNHHYISPASYIDRFYGVSVRCVADENQLPPAQDDSASGSISVKVANTLSIDAVSGMEEEVDSTSVANGTITTTIAANTNYKVLLSAEKTSLTSANTANTAEIPASTNVSAGTNAWGIRNSDNTTYSAITAEEKEYYNTTAPSTNPAIPGTVHIFNIGISVSPSLPADTYSTDVTITAAAI